MEKLLEDLLNFSLLGRRDVSRQPTNLKRIVRQVIDDLTLETKNRQIEWRLGDFPTADCDPALMNIVFVNLLSVAVTYTRPRDRAVTEAGSATLQGEPAIFVRDNGVGFDMKYADRLFGVLQRLHTVKKILRGRVSAWRQCGVSSASMVDKSGRKRNWTKGQRFTSRCAVQTRSRNV